MNINQEYFLQIVEQCRGCGHVTPGEYCDRYANPGLLWSPYKKCISRTHDRSAQVVSEKTVNPLKAAKRSVAKIGGI